MEHFQLIAWGHYYPDIKARQRYYEKGNYRPIFLINICANSLNYSQVKFNSMKMIRHHDPMWYIHRMQRWFNIKKINAIHHIYRMKDKNHMIILRDVEKAFDKIQWSFMIKKESKKERN